MVARAEETAPGARVVAEGGGRMERNEQQERQATEQWRHVSPVKRRAEGPAPHGLPRLDARRRSRGYGLRDRSPGPSTTSAMREPFGPTQEFLVSGYLSV